MKTIKIDDKVHKELLKLSVKNGFKRTLSNVIYDLTKPMPIVSMRQVVIKNQKGMIISFETISDILNEYDIEALKCQMCISLEKDYEENELKSIEFDFEMNGLVHTLNCSDAYIDVFYIERNIICAYVHIEKYLEELK